MVNHNISFFGEMRLVLNNKSKQNLPPVAALLSRSAEHGFLKRLQRFALACCMVVSVSGCQMDDLEDLIDAHEVDWDLVASLDIDWDTATREEVVEAYVMAWAKKHMIDPIFPDGEPVIESPDPEESEEQVVVVEPVEPAEPESPVSPEPPVTPIPEPVVSVPGPTGSTPVGGFPEPVGNSETELSEESNVPVVETPVDPHKAIRDELVQIQKSLMQALPYLNLRVSKNYVNDLLGQLDRATELVELLGADAGTATEETAMLGQKLLAFVERWSRSAVLSWPIPSQDINGQPITVDDLKGYVVEYGVAAGFDHTVELNSPRTTEVVIEDLPAGVVAFRIITVNKQGVRSRPSVPVSKLIAPTT